MERMHGTAIGQVLLDAGYIEDVMENQGDFLDGHSLYRFCSVLPNYSNTNLKNTSVTPKIYEKQNSNVSNGSFKLDLDLHNNTVQISKPSSQKMKQSLAAESRPVDILIQKLLADITKTYNVTNFGAMKNWSAPKHLSDENNETKVFNDLMDIFENHKTKFVIQSLKKNGLSENWVDTLIPLANLVVNEVSPDLSANSENMNICEYVQVKKLEGGESSDSCIVSGIVCSKNISNKAMASRISGPKILLLQCSIIYQRVEGKLLSLEPVIMQEHDYFKNIVCRIVSMKPDLVLVQKSVSRIAQELFNQMGVTLVLNVKTSILERIARCTGAEILTSVDAHMGKPVLGTCQQFYVEHFGVKSLMFFEGCPVPELGCSVLLRGSSVKQLKKLKIILKQLILMIYNWKFEKSYIMDQFATPQISNEQLNSSNSEQPTSKLLNESLSIDSSDISTHLDVSDVNSSEILSDTNKNEINLFQQMLDNSLLTLSPLVNFTVPYLESDVGKLCKLRKYFSKQIYVSKMLNNMKSTDYIKQQEKIESEINLKPKHNFITSKLTEDISSNKVQTMLALFRAQGGRVQITSSKKSLIKPKKSVTKKDKLIDVFDSVNHQRLPMMFYSFCQESNNAPSFCVEPRFVFMEFYGINDICLGKFLERYCFRDTYECPSESCDSPMVLHERRFIHDKGCVRLILSKIKGRLIEPPYNENLIYTWSYCKKCMLISPVVPISNDTWSMSFAKYLELKFHFQPSLCRALQHCTHCLNRDFIQFFVYNKTIASFEYSDIKLWEIKLPSLKLKIVSMKVSSYRPDVLEEVKQWALMGHEVFNAVMTKICSLSSENSANFLPLKQQLQKDQGTFKQRVDDIQLKITSPSLIDKDSNYATILSTMWRLDDSIVLLKKAVCEAILNWNSRLLKIDAAIKKEDKSQRKSETKSSNMSDILEEVMNFENATSQLCVDVEEYGVACHTSQQSLASESEIAADHDFDNIQDGDTIRGDKCFLSVPQAQSDITTDSDSDAVDDYDNNLHNEPKSQSSMSQSDKKSVKTILSQFLPSSAPPTIIPNPVECTEHHVLNINCRIPISVYEKEPSSIIAFTLSTTLYQESLSNSESISNFEQIEQDNIDQKEIDDKSKNKHHIELSFSDSTTNFFVKVYFAKEFAKLRSTFFVSGEEMYIRSLARCISWSARGGKSGSNFCKTKDDRFVLKEMSRLEIQPFLEFAPQYFNHIHSCQSKARPTLLCKIVGVYKVRYRNSIKGSSFNSNLLVMENLFYNKNISHIFDLKGSVRNRLVDPNSQDGEIVLLDENLIKMSCESPIYVFPHSKIILNQAINDDAEFLTKQLVMDYSLLVGLDEDSGELVLGIIDYIRTFTWDKRLETMVKKSGLLGGQGKLPTIISPEEYKNRFVAAMNLYFLSVPNRWTGMAKGFEYHF
ncbi:putative 1-phosphatidylinositol 3-phosphate 5-kinase isoform X2 [Adelges cooleyi]|uniref:putative 1-phosphatidylinositol 3-phosphate 5-kinase isoform X2 n=1 Tax=Adelges cooleyi TaxID=133065 RepID=UPI002180211C|nr:putative 1-phosphatidylinositol 3-phosphate 5-kinase isoform X2 [Adelges cooleyi]